MMLASELNLLKVMLTVTSFITHKRLVKNLQKNQFVIILTVNTKEMLHGWVAENRQRENGSGAFDLVNTFFGFFYQYEYNESST